MSKNDRFCVFLLFFRLFFYFWYLGP
jgi:hypothetical protein